MFQQRLRTLSVALVLTGGLAVAASVGAVPVRDIPGLVSISFFERTGGTGPREFVFDVTGPQLTTRLADPLGPGNFDMDGARTEFYDVYYSDAGGIFDLDGEYLTISGVYGVGLPAGGGLNLAEIGLNFSGAPTEFGNFVASSLALGDNGLPGTVGNAIDGNLLTHTTMGNTIGQTERLRVTLGFLSSSGPPPPAGVPEPGTIALFGFGLAGLGFAVRRRRA